MSDRKHIETLAIHSGSGHWSGSRAIASPMELQQPMSTIFKVTRKVISFIPDMKIQIGFS